MSGNAELVENGGEEFSSGESSPLPGDRDLGIPPGAADVFHESSFPDGLREGLPSSKPNAPIILVQQRLRTEIFGPEMTKRLFESHCSDHPVPMWLFRASMGEAFRFAVSTHAEPGSRDYNCGGLRIVPLNMVSADFNLDSHALSLGIGMHHKGSYAGLARIAGPKVAECFERISFGKHVVLPSSGSRIGEPMDLQTVDFIIEALQTFEDRFGAFPITGQDLGHGLLTTGEQSLDYISRRSSGCGRVNTGDPTAYGNFALLKGMLQGLEMDLFSSRIALFGCGNIGQHLLSRLLDHGVSEVHVCEDSPEKRRSLIEVIGRSNVWAPAQRSELLQKELDVVVFNANKHSLDSLTVQAICANPAIRIISGCENLIWPSQPEEEKLLRAGKIMSPTELCGIGGWLSAAEESLRRRAGDEAFSPKEMEAPLDKLTPVGEAVVRRMVHDNRSKLFADTLLALSMQNAFN